jgi:hypothetical protein
LVLRQCDVRDTPTLCISSATLVNFTMHSHSYKFTKLSFVLQVLIPSLLSVYRIRKSLGEVYLILSM